MKPRLFKRLTAAVCALLLILSLCPSARAASEPAVSTNRNRNCYGGSTNNWSQPVRSYLYENPSGGLTRVEYLGDGKIVAEDYSSSFQLQSSRTVPFELSSWGGFFAGETYNFLIFGQGNPNDSDGVETVRVVKYDKSWNRLGQYSLYGGNIYAPFDAGSLRCAEYDGYLYVRSCREMYQSSDGLHHQSSMTLQLRESDMSRVQYLDRGAGYVSHSFNQFILVDSDRNVVTLDHGDAYPRAAVIHRFTVKAGAEALDIDGWSNAVTESNIYEFPGKTGQNDTHAAVGALAETRTGYVSAFCRDDENSGWASRKIYLGYTHKSDLASSWTLVSSEPTVSNPHLAPTSLDGGYILWNAMNDGYFHPGDTLHYAAYSSYGAVGAVMTAEGAPLSDCAPILYNGRSVWYTTDDSVPTFYALDGSGVTATKANGSAVSLPCYLFSDVASTHWAYDAIREMVDRGLANGVGGGRFQPSGEMTAAQFSTFLARAFYGVPSDASGSPWYQPYVDELQKHGIFAGAGCVSAITSPISRYDMAQMLYNVLRDKGANISEGQTEAQGSIRDWTSVPEACRPAVAACYAAGLINGLEDGSFGGDRVMTRAQGCTVLSRALALLPETPGQSSQAYYSIEEFGAELLRLANEERAARGLPALQEWETLTVAAQIRAEELAVRNDENRPDGSSYASVLSQVGITGSDLNWRTENRFAGTFTTPEEVQAMWRENSRQMEMVCYSDFTHMGVGLYRADGGKVCCVQLFAQKIESNLTVYRTGVIGLVNQLRAEYGLPALQESDILTRAAQLAAQGNSAYIGTIVERELHTTYIDMVMSSSYRGSVNTPEKALSAVRQYLTSESPALNSSVTHVGVGFYRQANGQETCVLCFGRVK